MMHFMYMSLPSFASKKSWVLLACAILSAIRVNNISVEGISVEASGKVRCKLLSHDPFLKRLGGGGHLSIRES